MINRKLKTLCKLFFSLLLAGSISMVAAKPDEALTKSDADAESIVWNKKPIRLGLKKGQERIVHFPNEIRYWLPHTLKQSVSVIAANGVLYLTARQLFPKTRIRVQEIDTQKVYLLDISGDEEGHYSEEVIIMDSEIIHNKSNDVAAQPSTEDWYIRLARFAARSLYAPERLMPGDHEIQRSEVDSTQTVPLIRGGYIETTPIEAWQGGGLYVTAVLLKNTTNKKIIIATDRAEHLVLPDGSQPHIVCLDSDIRGQWLAAIPQHTWLGAAGTDDDRTSLYLISLRSFRESL